MSDIIIEDGYFKLSDGSKIRTSLPTSEIGFVEYENDFYAAKHIADVMHLQQKYGEHPYTYHLSSVEAVLRRFGFDADLECDLEHKTLSWDLITSAWLHDIVEDTPITGKQISRRFNHRVAGLVEAVTNPHGGNRKWRASQVYTKIKYTPHALTLKLADRIANFEETISSKSKFLGMYTKEWTGFCEKYKPLISLENEDMWAHLESLFESVS